MLPEPPLIRFAVSSTELLYERAMARFYKAVEYEEHENARKRSISVEQEARRRSLSEDPKQDVLMRLRNNSLTENDRQSILRRRLSGEAPNLQLNIPRKLSFNNDSFEENEKTQLNTLRNEVNTPDMIERSPSPQPPKANTETYSDDYTDSTASSEEEEVDGMIPTRRARQRKSEMSTYHPQMMLPYTQPENSEAAAVLTKPLPPLPDPNFKPKPILKRPASADGRKPNKPERKTLATLFGRRSVSPSPRPSPNSQRKSVEIDDVPRIIEPREFIEPREPDVPKPIEKVPEIKIEVQPEPEIEPEPEPDPITILRTSERSKQMLERRQSSIEENKVMADFYGDIIRDVTVRAPPKPKVPIYMDPEALKKLEIEDEEEEAQNDSGITSSVELSPQSSLSRPLSPPARTFSPPARPFSPTPPSGDSDFVFGRKIADSSKLMQKTEPIKDSETKMPFSNGSVLPKNDGTLSSTSSIDDSRGRSIKPKTGTIPKRRNVSQSRSRDSSTVRVPEHSSIIKNPLESTILNRREKSLSKTRNRSESKSPAAMNRKIIINRVAPPKVVDFLPPPPPTTPSPISSRTTTPSEMQEQVQLQVKTSMTYVTDVAILIFATYIYLFKSAILALPIIFLLLYRQISDKIPDWMKRKKS